MTVGIQSQIPRQQMEHALSLVMKEFMMLQSRPLNGLLLLLPRYSILLKKKVFVNIVYKKSEYFR